MKNDWKEHGDDIDISYISVQKPVFCPPLQQSSTKKVVKKVHVVSRYADLWANCCSCSSIVGVESGWVNMLFSPSKSGDAKIET